MFLFGGKKKETIKIQGDFTEKIKNTLKPRLCALC
jgi:translation initiation factor 1 (eIF-1/SUI1)